jgi:hypothetical protein
MIAALAFYRLLATASFTLLGLWFVVFLRGTAYLWLAYAERPAPLPAPVRTPNRV